jgi:hypothetical protein
MLAAWVVVMLAAACATSDDREPGARANREHGGRERAPAERKTDEHVPATAWSTDQGPDVLAAWRRDGGGGVFTSGKAIATPSTDVARTGDASARLRIVADGSTETSGARLFRWHESQELSVACYSAWMYFAESHRVPEWWNVFQFKSVTPSRNDPVWVLNVGNRPGTGRMYLYLFYWLREGPHAGEAGRRTYEQSIANLPVGRWTHLEVFLMQSSEFDGRITVWQDGTQLFDLGEVRTRYPDADNEWSVNNYAPLLDPSTATIYVDDAAVTRSGPAPAVRGPQRAPAARCERRSTSE